ncbi:MAG: hypothetical protein DWI59_01020 [Chloroflexi bacterium]|nr:MAG: hypothetical protein DWI59_01020 [Chloroflexota bacterium]
MRRTPPQRPVQTPPARPVVPNRPDGGVVVPTPVVPTPTVRAEERRPQIATPAPISTPPPLRRPGG